MCTYTYIHAHTYIDIHTRIYITYRSMICIYMRTCKSTYIHVYISRTQACYEPENTWPTKRIISIYIHTWHTHTHTHTHTHELRRGSSAGGAKSKHKQSTHKEGIRKGGKMLLMLRRGPAKYGIISTSKKNGGGGKKCRFS